MRKALLALTFTLLSITATIGSAPNTAFAHAGVVSTFPAQDQVLDAMPTYVEVTFSEDLLTIGNKEVNSLSLTHFYGPPVQLRELLVKGNSISAKIADGEYEAGSYELFYTIVSADGHKVTDSLTFSVNAPLVTSSPYLPEKNDGVLPLPIVGAIALVIVLGGFFALRARSRKL